MDMEHLNGRMGLTSKENGQEGTYHNFSLINPVDFRNSEPSFGLGLHSIQDIGEDVKWRGRVPISRRMER